MAVAEKTLASASPATGWLVPPRPPWEEEMNPTELLIFGSRFLVASELAEHGQIQDALAGLGEKAMGLSMRT